MDTRKVTFIATIAAIVLVAVGIGYAYTAMTTNSGNSVAPEYVTIVQGEAGAYTFAPLVDGNPQHVYWNSNDYSDDGQPKTDFTLSGVVDNASVPGYDMVQLGNDFTLVSSQVGNTTPKALSIEINANGFKKPTVTGAVIIMKATCNSVPQYFILEADNVFSALTLPSGDVTSTDHSIDVTIDGSGYYPVTVQMFYGYLTSSGKVTVNHYAGVPPVGPSEQPITTGQLTFIANLSGGNNPGVTALTGISVDKIAMNFVTGGDPQTATVIFDPSGATNKALTVTSSVTSVATVSYTAPTITVTPAGVGTSVITVVSAEGSYTAEITVNVVAPISVTVTDSTSATATVEGTLTQTVSPGSTITNITVTAAANHAFTAAYVAGLVSSLNGLTVAVTSGDTVLTISGTPTANVTLTLGEVPSTS